jgi:hypothetical protein
MNMNLRDAVALFISLGGTAEPKRKTGEFIARHPDIDKPLLINSRRKDTPRSFMSMIKKIGG